MDSNEFVRRYEQERPSKSAAEHMNRFFRRQPPPSADGDAEGDGPPPGRQGFDGGAGGRSFVVAAPEPGFNLNALLRGAALEKRERLIRRGGASD
jgi:hypothetical protein